MVFPRGMKHLFVVLPIALASHEPTLSPSMAYTIPTSTLDTEMPSVFSLQPTLTSPTPSPSWVPSRDSVLSIDSQQTNEGRTESGVDAKPAFFFRWSLLIPLIAVSAVAWTFRKSTRRCLCVFPEDSSIPQEITIDRDYTNDEDSIVGDRDTDVELVPVFTMRSHDWSELGKDPTGYVPRTKSDYIHDYSEPLSDFVTMQDNDF